MNSAIQDRVERGRILAHEHGDEFVYDEIAEMWRVPGSGDNAYYVDPDTGSCTCADRQRGQGRKLDIFCKHFYAVRFYLGRLNREMRELVEALSG